MVARGKLMLGNRMNLKERREKGHIGGWASRCAACRDGGGGAGEGAQVAESAGGITALRAHYREGLHSAARCSGKRGRRASREAVGGGGAKEDQQEGPACAEKKNSGDQIRIRQ